MRVKREEIGFGGSDVMPRCGGRAVTRNYCRVCLEIPRVRSRPRDRDETMRRTISAGDPAGGSPDGAQCFLRQELHAMRVRYFAQTDTPMIDSGMFRWPRHAIAT